ncbi:protein of unknown function [Nitrospira defluvii]|uniref:Uncharacterized protein n=1 Tax=Nitrospira defluvii TaxID=330214 RepID=D8P7L0_9BACT|nr:protein of unknown function [Nitrospira defluvii]
MAQALQVTSNNLTVRLHPARQPRTDLRALHRTRLFELHLRRSSPPPGGVRRMAGAL